MSLTLAGATLGAGIAAGVGALGSGLFNLFNQRDMTRQAWERDDTAISRRVRDLENSGLSPTLAAGSGANTSQPITSSDDYFGGAVSAVLGAMQQKANISATNAGTELSKVQATSEEWKQNLMKSQIDNYMANTLHLNKQNTLLDKQSSIFDLQAMSQINLNNAQAKNYLKNAELLGAKTIYEQTALDKLKTEIDIAKIQRDIHDFNRSWLPFDKLNEYKPTGITGQILGGLNYFRATGKQFAEQLSGTGIPKYHFYGK